MTVPTTAPHSTLQQQDAVATAAIRAMSVEMVQSIYSNTVSNPGSSANVINITPRNVGLITDFYVELTATIANTSTTVTLTPTTFNIANLLSQVTFTDLQNNQRINTAGWHLNLLNTVKGRRPFGSAFSSDSPIYPDNNWTTSIMSAPATIGPTTSGVVQMLYKIPLGYAPDDFRGAIFAGVVNSTMNLQLTINPNPVANSSTTDTTLAVYEGASGAGTISNVTITVYQAYRDQIPVGQNGTPLLPPISLSTIYDIKNSNITGMVVNQDFPVAYANFRDFLSTMVIFDNGGTLNTGSDINYLALQSANYTNIFKVDPGLAQFLSRQEIGVDVPKGAYYFSHRRKPLSTIQYGNMELIVNPKTVNSNASLLLGFEMFALINAVTGAGSLPAG